jgi:hypothetical protein
MTEKIIIVDNFYDFPHQHHKSFFENQCLITEETVNNLKNIIGNPIEIIDANNEVLSEGQNTTVCSHLTSDWIGVIYLSLPLVSFGEFGVKFYSHLSTGLETFPSLEDLQKYNISEDQLLKVFGPSLDLWKEYGSITPKYNRLILFKSNLWHSYGNGFGADLNTSMLYQKIIIRNG